MPGGISGLRRRPGNGFIAGEYETNEVLAAMDTISRAIYRLPREQQESSLWMMDQLAFLIGIISADD
jgi:hypothetical protein